MVARPVIYDRDGPVKLNLIISRIAFFVPRPSPNSGGEGRRMHRASWRDPRRGLAWSRYLSNLLGTGPQVPLEIRTRVDH